MEAVMEIETSINIYEDAPNIIWTNDAGLIAELKRKKFKLTKENDYGCRFEFDGLTLNRLKSRGTGVISVDVCKNGVK